MSDRWEVVVQKDQERALRDPLALPEWAIGLICLYGPVAIIIIMVICLPRPAPLWGALVIVLLSPLLLVGTIWESGRLFRWFEWVLKRKK